MPLILSVKSRVPEPARKALRDVVDQVQAVALRGDAVECPLCCGRFRRFVDFGDPPRPGSQCPKCKTLERHRMMWLFLKNHTNLLREQMRVLHVAPESALEQWLRPLSNLDYVTADIDPSKADVQMDITAIDYPDSQFDVVLCSHVLEHVPDAGQAMRELCRILSPTGFALLDVPMNPDLEDTYEDWSITTVEDRRRAFGQEDHVRWFGRNYPNLLRAAGFNVSVDPYPLAPADVYRFGLRAEDHIYYCTKPG
jgi:SAM-dependent methyltransferase